MEAAADGSRLETSGRRGILNRRPAAFATVAQESGRCSSSGSISHAAFYPPRRPDPGLSPRISRRCCVPAVLFPIVSEVSNAIRPARPESHLASPTTSLLASLAIVALMVAWLTLVGRPWVCPCGTVEFWQGELSQAENSQQFSDWYSALHVIYGMALFAFVTGMRPTATRSRFGQWAVASSAVWEAVENTPFLIHMFSHSAGAPDYFGDSVLNATGDTLFVVLGFFIAAKLPVWASVLIALALELAISLAIDDGLVIGTLRLLGVSVQL